MWGGSYEVGSSSNKISGFRQMAIESIALCASPPLNWDQFSCHIRGGRFHCSAKLTGSSGWIRRWEENERHALKNSRGVPEVTAIVPSQRQRGSLMGESCGGTTYVVVEGHKELELSKRGIPSFPASYARGKVFLHREWLIVRHI